MSNISPATLVIAVGGIYFGYLSLDYYGKYRKGWGIHFSRSVEVVPGMVRWIKPNEAKLQHKKALLLETIFSIVLTFICFGMILWLLEIIK